MKVILKLLLKQAFHVAMDILAAGFDVKGWHIFPEFDANGKPIKITITRKS